MSWPSPTSCSARETEGLAGVGPFVRQPRHAAVGEDLAHSDGARGSLASVLRRPAGARVPSVARSDPAAAVAASRSGPSRIDRERGAGRTVPGRLRRRRSATGRCEGRAPAGAARALLGAVRELREGRSVAFTPDGPRGPRREMKPGVVAAAQRAGTSVVPVHAEAERAWRLNSWDRFMIPKVGARVTVTYGRPFEVAAGEAGIWRQEWRTPSRGWARSRERWNDATGRHSPGDALAVDQPAARRPARAAGAPAGRPGSGAGPWPCASSPIAGAGSRCTTCRCPPSRSAT